MTPQEKKVIELALEALGTMDVFNPNRMEAITALRQAIAEAEKQDNFCDNNCVWTDHHPDCKLGKPNRQELQAKGEHPAPCARFCEANAFQIEIRNLKAKLENQHPEWYHTKNIYGCDVFYHKTEERSYMSGQITPLYTTPPQRKPLTEWIDPNDKTQERFLPNIGEPILFCHGGKTYYGQHNGGSFQYGYGVTKRHFNTWECRWMHLPAAHNIKE